MEHILLLISFVYIVFFAVIDWKNMAIPKRAASAVFFTAAITGIVKTVWEGQSMLLFLLSLIPGGFLILTAFVSGEKVGYGDGIVFLTLGALDGAKVISLTLMCTLLLSSAASILLLVMKKADLKTRIPMIPFAAAGFIAANVWLIKTGEW